MVAEAVVTFAAQSCQCGSENYSTAAPVLELSSSFPSKFLQLSVWFSLDLSISSLVCELRPLVCFESTNWKA